MPRDSRLYLDDILESCRRIQKFTAGMSFEEFASDLKTQDAVIRNFEVLGEAAGRLPDQVKAQYSGIEWAKIIAFRNILEALAKLNKTGTSAKAGVHNVLKRLDSCFRRNDGEGLLQEAHLFTNTLASNWKPCGRQFKRRFQFLSKKRSRSSVKRGEFTPPRRETCRFGSSLVHLV
ncbi:MAG: DUF86 domain-containing protein [Deltaproteobacteria bacterium]|nr:DUF86 domain-containing protein [Deltaproteobacteria bacterium]